MLLVFTATISAKLDDAIKLSEPQKGTVTLITAADCPFCSDMAAQKKHLQSQQVDIVDDIMLSADSEQARELIESLGITKLPALVFLSEEPIRSAIIKSTKESNAEAVNDMHLVWEPSQAPFVDIETGEVQGMVSVTYVTDAQCTDCFDAKSLQRPILQRFGVAIANERIVDIAEAEGAELQKRYNLTKVPTMVLSPDVRLYPLLANAWREVGTVETDGGYVLRAVEALQAPYKDLTAGKVVVPERSQ